MRWWALLLPAVLVLTSPRLLAQGSPTLEARTRALDLAYNLDYPEARAVLSRVIEAHPADAAALRSLAVIAWLEILFQRGAVTVDDYLGPVSRQYVKVALPPPELAREFSSLSARAKSAAQRALDERPRDIEARYERGAVAGLQVSFTATVEGRVMAAIGAARQAFNDHEAVLAASPGRKDAGLVVGTYRYVVGHLSFLPRLAAMVVGFGGDPTRGLRMIEEAAAFDSDTSAEAQFALVLLYNRERRYADALRVLAALQKRFPRNRLLWLEHGATALRAGRGDEAIRVLDEGFLKLSTDRRPRLAGEDALWRLKRGTAMAGLGRQEDATRDLEGAIGSPRARKWVVGRASIELGRLAQRRGDRTAARALYDRAASLCGADNDPVYADEARRLSLAVDSGR